MNNAMPEELFTLIKRLMEKQNPDLPPMSRSEEQRMELLMVGYRSDKHIRAWLTVAMDAYAKAVVEKKIDMFVAGFLHLEKMLFGGGKGGEQE